MTRHGILSAAATVCIVLAPFGAVHAKPPSAGTVVVYRGANLIDGTGGALQPDMAVIVDGENIKAVLPTSQLTPDRVAGAEVVDLKGAYVLPGLVESHSHLMAPMRKLGEAILRRQIYSGITTVRDPADDLRGVEPLARDARSGAIPAPDIYYAALVGGPLLFKNRRFNVISKGYEPGSAPWARVITETTDFAAIVKEARGTGATAIKIYSVVPAPLVRAVTAEAHRQGIVVWAHGAILPATPMEGVEADVDSVSHVCDLAYQVSDSLPPVINQRRPVEFARLANGDHPAMTALFEAMRARGTVLDATNVVYVEQDRRKPKEPICTAELAARLTNQAYRQGVQISTGTDRFGDREDPFPPLFEELEFLAEQAKMPPAQVIRSATFVGALSVGREAEIGTVAAGKLANLMIVAQNPLEDIRNLRSVLLTVKRGERFARAEFLAAR